MKTLPMLWTALVVALVFTSPETNAQRQQEALGRGQVAVRSSSTQVFLSWRLLGSDPAGVAFNVYRSAGGGLPVKLNAVPLTTTTHYVDTPSFAVSNAYTVRAVVGGVEQSASAASVLPVNPPTQQYMSVPLQIPPGGTTPDGVAYTYVANDCSVGDLDGDGEYEIILKWDPTNAKDNSQSGYTGPVFLDAYKLDGTRLWRIDLGPNIRAGAHYTQFMVFDLDGDGKAEIACRTAPGSRDGAGSYVGGAAKWQNASGPARPVFSNTDDYRTQFGYILSGPEFLTVFGGPTGAELVSTSYVPFRDPDNNNHSPTTTRINQVWGDNYGNRIDRFLAGVAYLDGQRPSLVMCRGYYTRTFLVAWDWRGGQLTRRWIFDSNANPGYAGQGAHSLTVGDVDADGRDEIVYGACTIDDNGTGLYTTGLGHGDALHLSDMNPNRPGLEVWMVHESPGSYGAHGSEMHDAATGAILFGVSGENVDVGRGVAADIDPRYPGYEAWASRGGLHTSSGQVITTSRPGSMNFLVWWDADLTREFLDGITISKWNHNNSTAATILTATGCSSNNSTKSTPALSGDILGDWREEVIWRTSDNTALRIYTTTIPPVDRRTTLMHDSQYRLAIAWQNVGYNQPPHPGFYLGAPVPAATPPTGLAAYGGNNQVSLTWNAVPNAASYNIKRSLTSGSGFTKVGTTTSSTFTDTGLTNGTTYYYRVSSENAQGESSDSSEVFATPANVVSMFLDDFESGFGNWPNAAGDTHDWTRDSGGTQSAGTGPATGAGESTWYLYLETSSGGANSVGNTAFLESPVVVGSSRTLTFFYHMFGLDMGSLHVDVFHNGSWTQGVWSRSGQQHTSNSQVYTQATVNLGAFIGDLRVRFRAVAAGGFLGDMAIDKVLITGTPPPPPSAPTELAAVPLSSSRIALRWNAPANALRYNVKRATTAGGPYAIIAADHSGTSYLDPTATPGTRYYYVVSAINAGGESADSDERSAITGPADSIHLLPAEIGSSGAVWLENEHAGFHGSGYLNFPTTGGYLEYDDIEGGAGGAATIFIRYALGNVARPGLLIVNGTNLAITFPGTGTWTNWVYLPVDVTLNSGMANTIRFESNGSDLGNIDEVIVVPTLSAAQNWRLEHFDTTANSGDAAEDADADGDGVTNSRERAAGTDPNDPASALKVQETTAAGGEISVSVSTVSGKTYRLEKSATMQAGSWTTVQDHIVGGGTVTVTDTPGESLGRCFYRIVVYP